MAKETVVFNIPIWADEALGRQNAEIFSMIYNATNSSRKCFDGSINYMIKQTGKSKSTLLRRLKELEEIGAIKRVGYNPYKNVKYVSSVDKRTIAKCQNDMIAKCQNDTMENIKTSKCQSVKMKLCQYQNETLQSVKMKPHKSIIKRTNNTDLKKTSKDIILSNDNMSSTLDDIVRNEGEKMIYKTRNEDSYDKTQNGWWKYHIFFPDDEELNDLFIKLLDKTAEEEKYYVDGCSTAYDIVNLARIQTKFTDAEIDNMTDEEFSAIPQEDLEPIDATLELKDVLRDYAYNSNRDRLNKYLGLTA